MASRVESSFETDSAAATAVRPDLTRDASSSAVPTEMENINWTEIDDLDAEVTALLRDVEMNNAADRLQTEIRDRMNQAASKLAKLSASQVAKVAASVQPQNRAQVAEKNRRRLLEAQMDMAADGDRNVLEGVDLTAPMVDSVVVTMLNKKLENLKLLLDESVSVARNKGIQSAADKTRLAEALEAKTKEHRDTVFRLQNVERKLRYLEQTQRDPNMIRSDVTATVIQQLKENLEEAEAELTEKRTAISAVSLELSDTKMELATMNTKNEALRKRVEELSKSDEMLNDQIERLLKENVDSNRANKTAQLQIQEYEEDLEKERNAFIGLREKFMAKEDEWDEKQRAWRAQLEEAKAATASEVSAREAALREMESKMTEMRQEVSRLMMDRENDLRNHKIQTLTLKSVVFKLNQLSSAFSNQQAIMEEKFTTQSDAAKAAIAEVQQLTTAVKAKLNEATARAEQSEADLEKHLNRMKNSVQLMNELENRVADLSAASTKLREELETRKHAAEIAEKKAAMELATTKSLLAEELTEARNTVAQLMDALEKEKNKPPPEPEVSPEDLERLRKELTDDFSQKLDAISQKNTDMAASLSETRKKYLQVLKDFQAQRDAANEAQSQLAARDAQLASLQQIVDEKTIALNDSQLQLTESEAARKSSEARLTDSISNAAAIAAAAAAAASLNVSSNNRSRASSLVFSGEDVSTTRKHSSRNGSFAISPSRRPSSMNSLSDEAAIQQARQLAERITNERAAINASVDSLLAAALTVPEDDVSTIGGGGASLDIITDDTFTPSIRPPSVSVGTQTSNKGSGRIELSRGRIDKLLSDALETKNLHYTESTQGFTNRYPMPEAFLSDLGSSFHNLARSTVTLIHRYSGCPEIAAAEGEGLESMISAVAQDLMIKLDRHRRLALRDIHAAQGDITTEADGGEVERQSAADAQMAALRQEHITAIEALAVKSAGESAWLNAQLALLRRKYVELLETGEVESTPAESAALEAIFEGYDENEKVEEDPMTAATNAVESVTSAVRAAVMSGDTIAILRAAVTTPTISTPQISTIPHSTPILPAEDKNIDHSQGDRYVSHTSPGVMENGYHNTTADSISTSLSPNMDSRLSLSTGPVTIVDSSETIPQLATQSQNKTALVSSPPLVDLSTKEHFSGVVGNSTTVSNSVMQVTNQATVTEASQTSVASSEVQLSESSILPYLNSISTTFSALPKLVENQNTNASVINTTNVDAITNVDNQPDVNSSPGGGGMRSWKSMVSRNGRAANRTVVDMNEIRETLRAELIPEIREKVLLELQSSADSFSNALQGVSLLESDDLGSPLPITEDMKVELLKLGGETTDGLLSLGLDERREELMGGGGGQLAGFGVVTNENFARLVKAGLATEPLSILTRVEHTLLYLVDDGSESAFSGLVGDTPSVASYAAAATSAAEAAKLAAASAIAEGRDQAAITEAKEAADAAQLVAAQVNAAVEHDIESRTRLARTQLRALSVQRRLMLRSVVETTPILSLYSYLAATERMECLVRSLNAWRCIAWVGGGGCYADVLATHASVLRYVIVAAGGVVSADRALSISPLNTDTSSWPVNIRLRALEAWRAQLVAENDSLKKLVRESESKLADIAEKGFINNSGSPSFSSVLPSPVIQSSVSANVPSVTYSVDDDERSFATSALVTTIPSASLPTSIPNSTPKKIHSTNGFKVPKEKRSRSFIKPMDASSEGNALLSMLEDSSLLSGGPSTSSTPSSIPNPSPIYIPTASIISQSSVSASNPMNVASARSMNTVTAETTMKPESDTISVKPRVILTTTPAPPSHTVSHSMTTINLPPSHLMASHPPPVGQSSTSQTQNALARVIITTLEGDDVSYHTLSLIHEALGTWAEGSQLTANRVLRAGLEDVTAGDSAVLLTALVRLTAGADMNETIENEINEITALVTRGLEWFTHIQQPVDLQKLPVSPPLAQFSPILARLEAMNTSTSTYKSEKPPPHIQLAASGMMIGANHVASPTGGVGGVWHVPGGSNINTPTRSNSVQHNSLFNVPHVVKFDCATQTVDRFIGPDGHRGLQRSVLSTMKANPTPIDEVDEENIDVWNSASLLINDTEDDKIDKRESQIDNNIEVGTDMRSIDSDGGILGGISGNMKLQTVDQSSKTPEDSISDGPQGTTSNVHQEVASISRPISATSTVTASQSVIESPMIDVPMTQAASSPITTEKFASSSVGRSRPHTSLTPHCASTTPVSLLPSTFQLAVFSSTTFEVAPGVHFLSSFDIRLRLRRQSPELNVVQPKGKFTTSNPATDTDVDGQFIDPETLIQNVMALPVSIRYCHGPAIRSYFEQDVPLPSGLVVAPEYLSLPTIEDALPILIPPVLSLSQGARLITGATLRGQGRDYVFSLSDPFRGRSNTITPALTLPRDVLLIQTPPPPPGMDVLSLPFWPRGLTPVSYSEEVVNAVARPSPPKLSLASIESIAKGGANLDGEESEEAIREVLEAKYGADVIADEAGVFTEAISIPPGHCLVQTVGCVIDLPAGVEVSPGVFFAVLPAGMTLPDGIRLVRKTSSTPLPPFLRLLKNSNESDIAALTQLNDRCVCVVARPPGVDFPLGVEVIRRPFGVSLPPGMTLVPLSAWPNNLVLSVGEELVQLTPLFDFPPTARLTSQWYILPRPPGVRMAPATMLVYPDPALEDHLLHPLPAYAAKVPMPTIPFGVRLPPRTRCIEILPSDRTRYPLPEGAQIASGMTVVYPRPPGHSWRRCPHTINSLLIKRHPSAMNVPLPLTVEKGSRSDLPPGVLLEENHEILRVAVRFELPIGVHVAAGVRLGPGVCYAPGTVLTSGSLVKSRPFASSLKVLERPYGVTLPSGVEFVARPPDGTMLPFEFHRVDPPSTLALPSAGVLVLLPRDVTVAGSFQIAGSVTIGVESALANYFSCLPPSYIVASRETSSSVWPPELRPVPRTELPRRLCAILDKVNGVVESSGEAIPAKRLNLEIASINETYDIPGGIELLPGIFTVERPFFVPLTSAVALVALTAPDDIDRLENAGFLEVSVPDLARDFRLSARHPPNFSSMMSQMYQSNKNGESFEYFEDDTLALCETEAELFKLPKSCVFVTLPPTFEVHSWGTALPGVEAALWTDGRPATVALPDLILPPFHFLIERPRDRMVDELPFGFQLGLAHQYRHVSIPPLPPHMEIMHMVPSNLLPAGLEIINTNSISKNHLNCREGSIFTVRADVSYAKRSFEPLWIPRMSQFEPLFSTIVCIPWPPSFVKNLDALLLIDPQLLDTPMSLVWDRDGMLGRDGGSNGEGIIVHQSSHAIVDVLFDTSVSPTGTWRSLRVCILPHGISNASTRAIATIEKSNDDGTIAVVSSKEKNKFVVHPILTRMNRIVPINPEAEVNAFLAQCGIFRASRTPQEAAADLEALEFDLPSAALWRALSTIEKQRDELARTNGNHATLSANHKELVNLHSKLTSDYKALKARSERVDDLVKLVGTLKDHLQQKTEEALSSNQQAAEAAASSQRRIDTLSEQLAAATAAAAIGEANTNNGANSSGLSGMASERFEASLAMHYSRCTQWTSGAERFAQSVVKVLNEVAEYVESNILGELNTPISVAHAVNVAEVRTQLSDSESPIPIVVQDGPSTMDDDVSFTSDICGSSVAGESITSTIAGSIDEDGDGYLRLGKSLALPRLPASNHSVVSNSSSTGLLASRSVADLVSKRAKSRSTVAGMAEKLSQRLTTPLIGAKFLQQLSSSHEKAAREAAVDGELGKLTFNIDASCDDVNSKKRHLEVCVNELCASLAGGLQLLQVSSDFSASPATATTDPAQHQALIDSVEAAWKDTHASLSTVANALTAYVATVVIHNRRTCEQSVGWYELENRSLSAALVSSRNRLSVTQAILDDLKGRSTAVDYSMLTVISLRERVAELESSLAQIRENAVQPHIDVVKNRGDEWRAMSAMEKEYRFAALVLRQLAAQNDEALSSVSQTSSEWKAIKFYSQRQRAAARSLIERADHTVQQRATIVSECTELMDAFHRLLPSVLPSGLLVNYLSRSRQVSDHDEPYHRDADVDGNASVSSILSRPLAPAALASTMPLPMVSTTPRDAALQRAQDATREALVASGARLPTRVVSYAGIGAMPVVPVRRYHLSSTTPNLSQR